MALGRGNIEIDVRARGLTQDVVRQVQDAERRIRPLSVTLDDKGFRQPLGRITGDLAEFQKSLDASVARTLAFGAAVGVLNAVTNGFKAMISSAVEVEKSLTDINVILNLNAKALENFSSQLFNTAKNTGQSFQTVSEAAVELSRQGLGAEETLKRINDAMILTRLSGMDAAKSVETLTAAINGFGSAALTTTELVNKLATVDAAFAVSTEDLSNALARAGSTAQGAKVSLDELLAAVTSVQQQTARGGSVIGNAFKSIFTRIQRSGVREALEEIGVATQDSTGNIRGALDILKDYARVYGTLSDAQRAYTDELVAGVFQINNLKALVKDLGSDYSIYQRALSQSNNATDEAVKRNQELQGTLAALINEASVNAKELASSLGELVATPAIENLLKLFNNLAGALNEALDPDKGSALIKGMFSAIGRFIAGPGLVLIGAAFIKLFKFITTQSLQAVKEVFKIGDASNRIADTQAKISFLLKDNQALYKAISNEALTHEQREELVLQTIKSQNAAYAQQQAMIDRLARSRTIGAAIGGGGRNRASGYIPNFANGLSGAINAEKQAISLGTGGASKSAKPKVLKSFPMGRGKKETIVANTDEVIVPNYGGGSGSAIFNQDMIKKAGGVPQGAIPVSQGYIPNFAKGKRGIDKGGKSIKDSKIWKNATDGYPNLSVDAQSIGGFGMISIKGNSGRFNQQKKINPFGSSYLGTEKGKEIIDEIAGSRLTAQDKQIVLSKIQKLGGGVLGVSFKNMGGATFSQLNGANPNDFAGQKGVFNDIIGGSIADATANISAKIYGRLFGDEIKANQLVSSVWREADKSKIVNVDAEGSIFEAAIRLGSKASSKTFGTNSGRGAWDFEETSNISPDLKEMFFDSVGYSKILRADAKRVGNPNAETEVINKAYRTPFFRDALEQIHKQQYTPLVQKAIQAKNDTSKAQGYIPNFATENVPTSQLTRFTRRKYSPKDIKSFGKLSKKNQEKFKQEVSEQDLLRYLLGKLRDKGWRSFISDNFIKKTTAWSKTNYTSINEQDFSSKAKTFNIKGGKSAYIYARGSGPSKWSAKIGTLLGGKKENKQIGGDLNSAIKQGWYRFDDVSIPTPDQSKSKINYQNLRQRIDQSLDKKIKGNTGISLNSLLGIGPEIFPKTNASIDDAWRGRYQKILKSNRRYYINRIKDYNKQFDNNPKGSRAKKQHQGRVTGRIFEELLASAQKAVTGETSYLSKLDTANWDFYNLTQEEKELLGVTANFGDYKTTLDSGANRNSFINKFIRQPNGADGFIPSFAGLSQLEHFQKYSYGRHGKTLDLQQFFPKSGTAAIGNLFKDVIDKAKAGDPYEKIVAGEIVGPRIPKMILRAKKTLDRARAAGLEQPKMRIEGRFDPGDLMATLGRNKGLYKTQERTAKILGKKFEPSKQGTGIKKKTLASKYVPGETAELTRTLKEMGVPGPYDKPGRTFYLMDLPIFSKGFAGGFIPNFANSLEEAIVREKDALASQRSNAKIYVDQDNRLRDPKNPMGLLVANTRDEPLSGSQGVNRAISSGINPKNKGAIDQMAAGYVPNFVIGTTLNIGKATTGALSKFGSSIKNLGGIFKKTSKSADDAGKATGGFLKGIGSFLGFTLLGEGLTKLEEATGKSTTGINIASTALFTDMSKTKKGLALLAGALFDFRGTIGEFLGFGPDTDRLTAAFEKYGEAIDNQINKIEQNIEKVDKFATSLSSLNKAAGSQDIEAYGKFLQQTLDQASELDGLDVDLVQNLIGSTGNVEKFNESIEELKKSVEQAKGIKTFSKDITELSKRVLQADGSFSEAGISEDEITSLASSLTKNLKTDQIDDFAKSLQGIGGLNSDQAKAKLLELQSVIGEFDDVTKTAILSGDTLAKNLLQTAAAQIQYKQAVQSVFDAYKGQIKPVKNLGNDIKKLASALEASSQASREAYKSLSETAKIQAGSRVERLKATGTISESDLLRGQASSDLAKISEQSSKEIEFALKDFASAVLKQGNDSNFVLKGVAKDIVDGISGGDLSTQSALDALVNLQADSKSFEKESQELISKTISSIQKSSVSATTERRKIQATLAAQLAAQENAAIALNRNASITEQELDALKSLGKEDGRLVSKIEQQSRAIESLIKRGADQRILNPFVEELKQQRQSENLKEIFSALASGGGVEFNAESLVELEQQIDDFVLSRSFEKLTKENQAAIVASKNMIDIARKAEREGGVKGAKDAEKAGQTLVADASIEQLGEELSRVMSEGLAKDLKIDDATLQKLNATFSDIPSLVNVISQTSAQNAKAIENNNAVQQKLNEALIQAINIPVGEQLNAAGKLEKAAIALKDAADALQGRTASGFIPNFAPDPVSRALNTESKMGAKRPILDSHPSIGAYVRDGATQPNFAAVKRDHPEGLIKAAKNSRMIQSATRARGFLPNFATTVEATREENLIDLPQLEDKKNIVLQAYYGGNGIPPFVDQNLLKEVYEDAFVHKLAKEIRMYSIEPSGYKNYSNKIDELSKPVTQKIQKRFSDLLFSDKNRFAQWSEKNYSGFAESVTSPLGTAGDVLGGISLTAGALTFTPLAPVAAPTAALTGTLSTMGYAASGIGELFLDTYGDPESLRSAYNDLLNSRKFAQRTLIGKPEDSLMDVNASELLNRTLKKSFGEIQYPLYHELGSGVQRGLLEQAKNEGALQMDLFNAGSATLGSSILPVSSEQQEISKRALAVTKFGTGGDFEKSLTKLQGVSGVANYINGITNYKNILAEVLKSNESFNIPFDFKEFSFAAQGETGWKVGETSTRWSLDELKKAESRIAEQIDWERTVLRPSLNDLYARNLKTNPTKAEEYKTRLGFVDEKIRGLQEAGSLSRKYIKQFENSKNSFRNMFVDGRGNVDSDQLDGRLLSFPNPFVQGSGPYAVGTPDMRKVAGEGGDLYMARNKLLDHMVSTANRNQPTADAIKFIDDTFNNGAITSSQKAIDSLLSTNFDTFIAKMSLVKPRAVSQGIAKSSLSIISKDIEATKLAIEKNQRQKKIADEIEKKGLEGIELDPKDKEGIEGQLLPGADAIDPVVQAQKDALAGLGANPQELLDRLKQEEKANETRKETQRDQLYLQLLGQETERIRESDASIKALERIMRISDKMLFFQDDLDKMILQRQRRAKSIRDNPYTTKKDNLPQIESEIKELESRKRLYQQNNEEGMAYLFFANQGKFSRVGPDQKSIGAPVYESIDGYAQKFQELRQRLALDSPTEAEQRIKELKEQGKLLNAKFDPLKENYIDFARIRNQEGNKGSKTGAAFESFFTGLDYDGRLAYMRKIGARDELPGGLNEVIQNAFRDGKLDETRKVLLENLTRVGNGDPAFGFLVDEAISHGSGLGEDNFMNAIRNLGVPFNSGVGIGDKLSQEKVKIKGIEGVKGLESYEVNALENSDVESVLSFMNKLQLQDWLKKNDEATQNIEGNPFQNLSRILAKTSHQELMKSPVYIKYLKDKLGFKPDRNFATMLEKSGNVKNFEQWNELYGNPLFLGQIVANQKYGEIQWGQKIDDKIRIGDDGLNPVVKASGDADIKTIKQYAENTFGTELYHGTNTAIDEFLRNTTNPVPELRQKKFEGRAQNAINEFNESIKKIKPEETGAMKSYAPFGYDSFGPYKKDSPKYNGRPPIALFTGGALMGQDAQKQKARGFIPNFSKVAGEISASRMAGYKSPVTASQVKSINIPGVGQSTFNTQESVFKASGMSQPFIVPPANSKAAKPYAKQVQRKFNFNPYGKRASADGFIPNFAPNGNGFDFSEMQQSIRLFEEATLLFSKQSEVLRSSANSFQESANKISELQNQEPVNFERLTSAASKIEISFDKLSSNLNQALEINSSSIETSMDNLATALSNMQASMTVSIPDVNVNINGAAQITDSISSLLQAQIPQLVQNEISKMNLATKFDIGMN